MNLNDILISQKGKGRIKTDKGRPGHNYVQHYSSLFDDKTDEIRNILEIGVYKGASLKMWEKYFSSAIIHGIDINPECKVYEEDRVKIHIIDQEDKTSIKAFGKKCGPFDLIVDDGSHKQTHSISCFEALWPFVSPGGIYAVEDVHVSSYYGDLKPEERPRQTTVEFFSKLIHEINLNGNFVKGEKFADWRNQRGESFIPSIYEGTVFSIQFYCGLILIEKYKGL